MDKQYILIEDPAAEPFTLDDILKNNELAVPSGSQVGDLQPGETMKLGGGEQVELTLKRIK